MPGARDPVQVDEREPALADDLGVVARDRLAPPRLLDPPAIADLDRLAPAVPADRHESTVDRNSTSIGGCPRRSRVTPVPCRGLVRRGRPAATPSGARAAALRDRGSRRGGSDRRRRSGRAARAASRAAPSGAPGARTRAAAGRPPRVAPRSSSSSGATAPAAGSARAWRGAGARSASASAVGSGKRCSTASPRRGPGSARRRDRARGGGARSAASPRAASCPASATARRRRTNRIGSSSATAGSIGSAEDEALRSRGGDGRARSPARGRARGSGALPRRISPPAPTRPARRPGRSGAGRTGQPGADIRVGGSSEAGRRRRGTRLGTRRDDDRRTGLGGEGRHGRGEARAGDPVRGRLPGQRPGQAPPDALDEDRLGAPQALEPVDLGLEQPERDVGRVGRAGKAGLKPAERLERGLEPVSVSLGLGVEEGRLRDQPVGAPERHPAPDAERAGGRVGVDDRSRSPRSRRGRAGRSARAGASGRLQVEEEVRRGDGAVAW